MEKVKISAIKANSKNPRVIKDDKFKKLVKSIQDFPEMLEKRPLVCFTDVDGKFVVLGGNMRLKAAQEVGLKELPIVLADDWTQEQRDEFLIKDNVGFGEWDWDMLANEYDEQDLKDWGLDLPVFDTIEELEAEEDDFDTTPPEESITVLSDLYEIGEHRLLCGDSTDSDQVAKLMNGQKADMVFTDPPYNVNYVGSNGLMIENDNLSNEDFYSFLYNFFVTTNINLKNGGVYYVWHTDNERINFTKAFEDADNKFSECLIWVKNSLVLGHLDYHKKHETCLYGWKKGEAHYFTNERTHTTVIEDKLDINKLSKQQMKDLLKDLMSEKTKTTVIHCDKPQINKDHPTMKPILLVAPLLQNSSLKDELVYDGFLGSGSTMVASHQLKRKCYGMELDPKYCDVIVNRMIALDPNIEIKLNGKPFEKAH
jgi:DNA modification methylase